MSLDNIIKHNSARARRNIKEKRYKNVIIFEIDPLPEELDLLEIVKNSFERIPEYMVSYIDAIYVGQFEDLKRRSINAKYKDRAIYMTNEQDDMLDAMDDIVHEVAHAVEDNMAEQIYGDGQLEREFLSKREKLFNILSMDSNDYTLNRADFMKPEYDSSLDRVFFSEIGYANLAPLTVNLFNSPYGVTSLREYFANGFEAFFLEQDLTRLQAISPVLYEKLVTLIGE